MEDTFTLLPLHLDPSSKAISSPTHSTPALSRELTTLNATHRALLTLDTPHAVPPPPLPLNPKRSAAIQKMREQGNVALNRRNAAANANASVHDSIKFYTYAIDMALGRLPWEPAAVVRDELAILMSNRSQAYMTLQMWPEGAADAEASVEMKAAPGQGKAWWRRGKCLLEMGRWEEAGEWIDRALDVEGMDGGKELAALRTEVDEKARRAKARK
jgi:translocation protein SEC72